MPKKNNFSLQLIVKKAAKYVKKMIEKVFNAFLNQFRN